LFCYGFNKNKKRSSSEKRFPPEPKLHTTEEELQRYGYRGVAALIT
jgi:hypothetical protein